MKTKYAEQFESKNKRTLIKSHKEAFNLEKETKILNNNKMNKSLYTTQKLAFKGKQEKQERPQEVKHIEPHKPMQKETSYAKNFPSWNNGHYDVFHEKHPQYPYYEVRHRGNSHY